MNNLTLPAGDRSITVASGAAGGMLQLVAGGSTTPDNDGGSIELVAGAGAGTGVNGDIRVGVELAGVPNATYVRIGKIESPNTNNQILVDTVNNAVDINGLYGFGGGGGGNTFLVTDILWQHRDGGGGGGGNCTLRVMDAQVTLEDSSPLKLEGATGRNSATGPGYKGSLILMDGGIGGDSTGNDGDGGSGGGGDWYGGNGGAGDGAGDGGIGGTITLHAGDGGAPGPTGGGGVGGIIHLKPGIGQSIDSGYDGAVIVGNAGFVDDFTYLIFTSNMGAYAPWSNGPGLRWNWTTSRLQVYAGAISTGSWSDIPTSAGILRGEYAGVAGVVTTVNTGYTTIGSIPLLDPRHSGSVADKWAFVCEIFQSGGGTATIRLYNATDSTEVAGTAITSTSTTPEQTRVWIEAATGFVMNAEKTYEVHLKVTTGTAVCRNARVEYMKLFTPP